MKANAGLTSIGYCASDNARVEDAEKQTLSARIRAFPGAFAEAVARSGRPRRNEVTASVAAVVSKRIFEFIEQHPQLANRLFAYDLGIDAQLSADDLNGRGYGPKLPAFVQRAVEAVDRAIGREPTGMAYRPAIDYLIEATNLVGLTFDRFRKKPDRT
jgi:hypothetical protein